MIKTIERGWAGHFICAKDCLFRRNTLVVNGKRSIVVSTVGNLYINEKLETIGIGRHYETMAFIGVQDGNYIEANVGFQVNVSGDWSLQINKANENNADNLANDMHEKNVRFVVKNFDKLYKR